MLLSLKPERSCRSTGLGTRKSLFMGKMEESSCSEPKVKKLPRLSVVLAYVTSAFKLRVCVSLPLSALISHCGFRCTFGIILLILPVVAPFVLFFVLRSPSHCLALSRIVPFSFVPPFSIRIDTIHDTFNHTLRVALHRRVPFIALFNVPFFRTFCTSVSFITRFAVPFWYLFGAFCTSVALSL